MDLQCTSDVQVTCEKVCTSSDVPKLDHRPGNLEELTDTSARGFHHT